MVHKVYNSDSNEYFAMKEVEIKNNDQFERTLTEISLLKTIMEEVNHPNILNINRVLCLGNTLYITSPLCTGRQLLVLIHIEPINCNF